MFYVVEVHHFLGPRTDKLAWFIIQFVINLRAIQDQLAKLVPLHPKIVVLLDHAHILNFMDRSNDSHAQETIVWVVYEILRVQNRHGNVHNSHGNQFTIYSVVEME